MQGSGVGGRRPLTDRDAYEQGFEDGIRGRWDSSRWRSQRHQTLYARGHTLGEGAGVTWERAMELGNRARAAIAFLPPMPEEGRRAPCHNCHWIGVCATTGATCTIFRIYVADPGDRKRRQGVNQAKDGRQYTPRVEAMVPDRDWSGSFGGGEGEE